MLEKNTSQEKKKEGKTRGKKKERVLILTWITIHVNFDHHHNHLDHYHSTQSSSSFYKFSTKDYKLSARRHSMQSFEARSKSESNFFIFM